MLRSESLVGALESRKDGVIELLEGTHKINFRLNAEGGIANCIDFVLGKRRTLINGGVDIKPAEEAKPWPEFERKDNTNDKSATTRKI